jgi:hypothetical protein
MGKILNEKNRIVVRMSTEEVLHKRVYLQGDTVLMPTSLTIAGAIQNHAFMLLHKHAPHLLGEFHGASVELVDGKLDVVFFTEPQKAVQKPPWE